MQLITIEIINNKALQLLNDLEDLKLIRLISNKTPMIHSRAKPSELRGGISAKTTEQLLQHIEQSRKEWE